MADGKFEVNDSLEFRSNKVKSISDESVEAIHEELESLQRRMITMPTNSIMLYTIFNDMIKEWVLDNVGEIKKGKSNTKLITNADIGIMPSNSNKRIQLSFLIVTLEKDNGNQELKILCSDIKYIEYKNQSILNFGFKRSTNPEIKKIINLDAFSKKTITLAYNLLFEVFNDLDIKLRPEIEKELKKLITNYMQECINIENREG